MLCTPRADRCEGANRTPQQEGRVASGTPAAQQAPAFNVPCRGEVIEHAHGNDFVRLCQLREIALKRRRLTRYVKNVLERSARAKRLAIKTGAGRIDENGVEGAKFGRCLEIFGPKFFAVDSKDVRDVGTSVSREIAICRLA